MKVVYVPLTIPFYVRSIVALFLMLLSIVTLGIIIPSTRWYVVQGGNGLKKDNVPERQIQLGPYHLNLQVCRYHDDVDEYLCDNRPTVFFGCRNARSSSITLFGHHSWCEGYVYFIASFGCLLAAALFGLLGICCSFVREGINGLFGIFVVGLSAAGVYLFYRGEGLLQPNLIQFERETLNELGHVMSYGYGPSMYAGIVAVIVAACSTLLSMSLCCCCRGESDIQKAEVNRPPAVQVVRNAKVVLDEKGRVSLPRRPGFQQITPETAYYDDTQHLEMDEDDEFNNAPHPTTTTRAHPATTTTAKTTSTIRKEDRSEDVPTQRRKKEGDDVEMQVK